jgi:hypothetical protein
MVAVKGLLLFWFVLLPMWAVMAVPFVLGILWEVGYSGFCHGRLMVMNFADGGPSSSKGS